MLPPRISCALTFVLVPLLMAAFTFSGVVVDQVDNTPLQDVSIRLSYPEISDSTVSVSFTDITGAFSIDGIQEGKVRIIFSHKGYDSRIIDYPFSADAKGWVINLTKVQPNESQQDETALDGIVVTADLLKEYVDHDVMYLSPANRAYGVNALDAISSLPRFLPGVNNDILKTIKGEMVDILINGRRGSIAELKNLKGDDIMKVEYYENPPARFAPFASSSIVNIILKQPSKLKFEGNITVFSNFMFLNTGGDIGFVLADPKNYVNVTDGASWSKLNNFENALTYNYGSLKNIYLSYDGRQKNSQNILSGGYQWTNDGNILYANVTYSSGNRHGEFPKRSEQIASEGIVMEGRNTYGISSNFDLLSLDVYFSRMFRNGQSLCVDIVNSLNKSGSQSNTLQQDEDDNIVFDYQNSSRNRVYSLITDVMYDLPLSNGRLSASLSNRYVRLTQNFNNGFLSSNSALNHNISDISTASASYAVLFGRFTLNGQLKLQNDYNSLQGVTSINKFYVKPDIRVKYKPVTLLSVNAHVWVETLINSMGKQNDNISYVDTYYLLQNNPDIKDSRRYCEAISLDLNLPLRNSMALFIGSGATYRYTPTPFIPLITRREIDMDGQSDMYYIKRSEEIPFLNEVEYFLYASWKIGTKFSLSPMLNGIHTAYNTPNSKIRFNNVRFRMDASYSFSEFFVNCHLRTPTKIYSGNTLSHKGWGTELSMTWRHRQLFASLKYAYTQPDQWELTEVPGFSIHNSTISLFNEHSLSMTIGYSFVTGNRQTDNKVMKRLRNAESETGL